MRTKNGNFCLFLFLCFILTINSCSITENNNRQAGKRYTLTDYIPITKDTVILFAVNDSGKNYEFKKKFNEKSSNVKESKREMQTFLQWLDSHRWKNITIWFEKNEKGENIIQSVK